MRNRGNINISLYLSIHNIAQNETFVQKEIGAIYKTAINLYFYYFKAFDCFIAINILLYIFIFYLYLYYYNLLYCLLYQCLYDLLKSILSHFFILLI